MSFFDKLKTEQARATHGAQRDQTQNRPTLLSPESAPTTMSCFPPDFHRYTYEGPAIEKVTYLDTRGEASYRRALVAQMVRREEAPPDHEGNAPSSSIGMTASVRDLVKAKHPQAREIALALGEYYNTKVYGAEKAQVPPVKNTARALSSKLPSLG